MAKPLILAATAAATAAAFATRATTAWTTATAATACGLALKGISTDVAPGGFRGVRLMRSIRFSTATSTSSATTTTTAATVTPPAKSHWRPTSSTVWLLDKPFVVGLLQWVRNRAVVRKLLARRAGLLHGALVKGLLQRVGDRAVFR